MKLLAPKDLNNRIQEQNNSEAKAGLFLAKKVDRLREEVQEVQAQHDTAIDGLTKEFQSFMTDQSLKREFIIKEIETLKEEKRLLQIPLDDEWQIVKNESKELELLRNFLSEKEENLAKKENNNIALSENNLKRQGEIENSENIVKRNLEISLEKKQEADSILITTKEYEIKTKEELEVRTKAVSQRETDIAYREVDVDNRNKNALAREEANRKETLRIESKQRQLRAAFAELEKRNGKRS